MIQLVAYCLCLIIATGVASPVPDSSVDLSAEARRIVRESYVALVGPNTTIVPRCRLGLIKIAEDAGDVYFYLPEDRLPPESDESKSIELTFNDRGKGNYLTLAGRYQKLEVGSDAYTRGVKAYDIEQQPAGHLFKVDVTEIILKLASADESVVGLKEYYAGTDSPKDV